MSSPAGVSRLDQLPAAWDILLEWTVATGRTGIPRTDGQAWIRDRLCSVLSGERDGQSLAVVEDLSYFALTRFDELTAGDEVRTRCICFVYRAWLEMQCRGLVQTDHILVSRSEVYRKLGEAPCARMTPEELAEVRRMILDRRGEAQSNETRVVLDTVDLLVMLMAARGIAEHIREQFHSGAVERFEELPCDWHGVFYSLHASHVLCGSAIKGTNWAG